MSFWPLRKRTPSQPFTGANLRISHGAFGSGGPQIEILPESALHGIYHYHIGDLFNPGTGNFVFENQFELPLVTLWGRAATRTPNTFNPFQPPQIMAPVFRQTNGLGGLQAGQMALEPLILPNEQGGA